MTDTERERINAICEVAGVTEIDDLSDGFHTFRQLYYQRMMLFATIVKQNRDKAWKSLRHEDGELCFGGRWFIVGIDTPEGSYTYHYEDNYYSLFDCEELERGKHWDGHTEKDVTRLLSLPRTQLSQQGTTSDLIDRQAAIEALARMMPRSYTPDGSHPADEEIFRAQEIFADCIEALEILPSAQPEPYWIPCSERLPENDNEVLITVWDAEDDYVEVYKGFYQGHEWWTQWCHGCSKIKDEPCGENIVIAWMPLPASYKGE